MAFEVTSYVLSEALSSSCTGFLLSVAFCSFPLNHQQQASHFEERNIYALLSYWDNSCSSSCSWCSSSNYGWIALSLREAIIRTTAGGLQHCDIQWESPPVSQHAFDLRTSRAISQLWGPSAMISFLIKIEFYVNSSGEQEPNKTIALPIVVSES